MFVEKDTSKDTYKFNLSLVDSIPKVLVQIYLLKFSLQNFLGLRPLWSLSQLQPLYLQGTVNSRYFDTFQVLTFFPTQHHFWKHQHNASNMAFQLSMTEDVAI